MEKTFNAEEAEPRITKAWEAAGAFEAGAGAEDGAEKFCVMIPPPNVTGSLHMGHAFNNTLQDILVRWHRMRGHDTLWQPGTDHAGIATQMVTEREMAEKGEPTRQEMGREKFLERVWQQKSKSRGTIIGQLKRLGASCDWSREAFTMGGAPGDPEPTRQNFHDAVIRVFVDMHGKGLINRGKRLVNWDPHFETAISDLEVENIDVDGHMWHFKYPLADGATYTYVEKDGDGNVVLEEERDYISIATTRPETMLGDGAVAVHPSDERYAPIVGRLCEIPVGPKEHRRLIPIITDEYPDPEFGSGAVKITGAHDFNDHEVAKRGGIPMYRLMALDGSMRKDGAPYAEAAAVAMDVAKGGRSLSPVETDTVNLVPDDLRGLDRFEARKRVVEQITREGLAVMVPDTDPRLGKSGRDAADAGDGDSADDPGLVPLVEAKKITQPFGDRSKVVIEPMLTDQWFVDTAKIVGPAIDAVRGGSTRIIPEQHAKVYFHWLENIEPWCISRQLWWGHQIPVWYGPSARKLKDFLQKHSGEGNPASEQCSIGSEGTVTFCAANADEAYRQAGIYYREHFGEDIVVDESGNPGAPGSYSFGNQPSVALQRDPDVLDTWFSSGLWPIGTLGWPEKTPELEKYFPTSVLITGFDIIFFWVARMMMMQYAVVGERPFDTVYVHPLVRDEKGKKMSKSLGNVLDPLELIAKYGADAVRFTLAAMAAMGRDLKLSTSRIEGYRNFGTKLWNAARFAEMNGALGGAGRPRLKKYVDRDTAVWIKEGGEAMAPPPKATVNRWIIAETARVREAVDGALEAYRFNDAANALYGFVWHKVCDWYVEFSKPLFDGDAADETRDTMAWVIDQCLVMLHPFMPFITEEIWAIPSNRDRMLALARWPSESSADLAAPDGSAREMEWVISLIEEIRSVRGEMGVPAGARLTMLKLELDSDGESAWAANRSLIERLARIEKLESADSAPKGSATVAVEGGTFALPLAGVIDVAAEKARLEKAVGKLDKDMKGLGGRLSNPKFVESAPEDVVAETRELLALKEAEAARLGTALDRLREFD